MSYCRFSNSDAYIFEAVGGVYQCMCCKLQPKDVDIVNPFDEDDDTVVENAMHKSWHCDTLQELLDHVQEHRENGDYIPDEVDKRLKKEIDDLD